jgi:type VI protein secretion system component VasK
MEFYPWVVLAHVVLVILAFGAHGVSAFAMFAVKRETERARIGAVLDLSTMALLWAGVLLILAVVTGIAAAIMAGHFGRLWPWVSIGVVVVVWIAMTPLAGGRMRAVRKALGIATRETKKGETPTPETDAELAAAQAKLQPGPVMGLGVVAIAVLVWLMESKPF